MVRPETRRARLVAQARGPSSCTRGPINRGVEIDSAPPPDSDPQRHPPPRSTNGIAVRMAVLYLCAGGQPEAVLAPVE